MSPTMPPEDALVVGSIGLVRSLAAAGIPFYLGWDTTENPARFSRHAKRSLHLPPYDSREFAAALAGFGASLQRPAPFFCDDDRALLAFSAGRDLLHRHFLHTLPGRDLVAAMLDKEQFALLARRLGLPTPRTLLPAGVEELRQSMAGLLYPVIVKPQRKGDWWNPEFIRLVGRYNRGIYCYDEEELIRRYSQICGVNPRVVIQEVIPGRDDESYSINMYFNAARELRGYFIGRKHRIYPVQAGQGCYVVTVKNDDVLDAAMAIAGKLEMVGFLNIQFKRNAATGEFLVIEMHPRCSVWNYLGTKSGVNLPAIGYCDMVGTEYTGSREYTGGVAFVDVKRDIRAFPEYRRRGELRLFPWFRTFLTADVYDLFEWGDPLPFLMDLLSGLKRLWRAITSRPG